MVQTTRLLAAFLLISTSSAFAADFVLVNGVIYSGNVDNPWSSSIAVDGDSITYVGNEPSAHIHSDTQVYDLDGRLVIPGIIDAHAHPGMIALSTTNLELDESNTRDELMAAIEKLVRENPERDVLIAGFWANDLFDVTGPRKEDLDKIEPDRPLIIYDDWAHTVWANSAALKVAGVTRHTEDIVPGFSFYQKDEDGEPTGWITESAASVFINNFLSVSDDVRDTLKAYLDYNRDIGITTLLDAGNFGLDREIYEEVSRLDKAGELPVRYHGAYTLFRPQQLPTAIEDLKALAREFNSDKLRIDTMKVFFDGILETRTAALSSDYLDTPGNSGDELLTQEQVHQLILGLEKEGLNLHVHSVGDRGTTTILNAVEDARRTLSRAQTIRIAICHLEIVKQTDFTRFKELDVVAQFTPHWAVGGDPTWYEEGIGKQAYSMQRAQPLLSDGAAVTFSSDVTDVVEFSHDRANPFVGMQVGHNRQDIGVPVGGEFMPPLSERLQRKDLVNGYTSQGAYQLGREEEFGTLEEGLMADFLILNQNLFDVHRYDIHKTKPVAVIVAGRTVAGSIPGNTSQ